MTPWLQFKILDNTIESYIWFLAIVLAAFILRRYLSKLINLILYRLFRFFSKQDEEIKFQSAILRPMEWLIMFLIIAGVLESLNYPVAWHVNVFDQDLQEVIDKVKWMIILFAFARVLLGMVDFVAAIMMQRASATESKTDDQLVPFVKDGLRIIIYIFFLLILLGAVFDFNITSLLAGLGIGGLAVAFAAQESIKDLFGSFTIFFDKPFTVGDVVKVGDVEGTVEKVGFRSTRIRSYDQTFVTMPNKKMMENHVDNLTQRQLRRVRMTIGITYRTPSEQIKKIMEEIRTAIVRRQFDRDMVVALEGFGESSLNLLVIYYTPYVPAEQFFSIRSEMNFEIMEIIYRNGSSFAFPVREIVSESKKE